MFRWLCDFGIFCNLGGYEIRGLFCIHHLGPPGPARANVHKYWMFCIHHPCFGLKFAVVDMICVFFNG